MDFFEVVAKRRSVRYYTDQIIEDEKLHQILECAIAAPSAGNLQAYEIVVVREEARRNALAVACLNQHFVAEAPLSLVFLTNPKRSAVRYEERGEHLYCLQDATLAAAYSQLAVEALGLGTVWVGAFDEDAVAKVVEAKADFRPVAVLPIGYRTREPKPRPRKQLTELVHYEHL